MRRIRQSFLILASIAVTACNGDVPSADGASPLTVRKRTPVYGYDVVRSYPHDEKAFTQGLFWLDGELYEGTGQIGTSNLRRVDLETGKVLQQRDLPAPHFGEGIAELNGLIYQLTWTSNKAYVYDRKTFEPKGEFTYQGEGWGITTNGSELIMSDGTATVRFLNPSDFSVTRRIVVSENGTPVKNINELEWVKGELWANVWMVDQIARIDPQSGVVLGWINLTGIHPASMRRGDEDVLNGIAYDSANDRIFVTGKLWSRLYEIKVRPGN